MAIQVKKRWALVWSAGISLLTVLLESWIGGR